MPGRNSGDRIDQPLPKELAIAFAGPVGGDVLKLTNNPWVIRPALMEERLGVERFVIVNDFAAIAHAVAGFDASAYRHVCGPEHDLPDAGVISIVGPGTGLGVASLLRRAGGHDVIATEGGHVDWAPLDPLEDRILEHLRENFRRVSVERLVSGRGLLNIYEALGTIENRPYTLRDEKDLWSAALTGTRHAGSRRARPALPDLRRFGRRLCACPGRARGSPCRRPRTPAGRLPPAFGLPRPLHRQRTLRADDGRNAGQGDHPPAAGPVRCSCGIRQRECLVRACSPTAADCWPSPLGVIAVTSGVLLHLPMFWMGRHMHFMLAGMPMDADMIVGMALIVGGVAVAAYGLLPRNIARHACRVAGHRRLAARGRAAADGALEADGACWSSRSSSTS